MTQKRRENEFLLWNSLNPESLQGLRFPYLLRRGLQTTPTEAVGKTVPLSI